MLRHSGYHGTADWPKQMCDYGAGALAKPDTILDAIPLGHEGVLPAAAF